MIYDVIIIGAGPAGLTASIYCARAGKSVLVVEKETLGGKITETPVVYNIPGFSEISGAEFGANLTEQAQNQGVEILIDEITSIEFNNDDTLKVIGDFDTYCGKTCIIATGTKNRGLGLPHEEEFTGSNISYCVTCDGPLYVGKDVAVVGGGNSAVTYALELAGYANRIYVIQNLAYLTAEKSLCDKLYKKDNVEIITNSIVTEYLTTENGLFKGIQTVNTETKEDRYFILDGVFLAIGLIPDNDRFRKTGSVAINEKGFIQGTMPPIFACGDCTDTINKQVVIAAASGAETALKVLRYLH